MPAVSINLIQEETHVKRVVIVTDGDCKALEAVEVAAANVGARCISISACRHPDDAYWTPAEIEELILSAPGDLVIVLADDEGKVGEGRGEAIIRYLSQSVRVDVIGIVAVASDLDDGKGAHVDASVTADGRVIKGPVDKKGNMERTRSELHGDTVENLDELDVPVVIGLGDPGKMDFADDARRGAPVTTKAIELILSRSGRSRGHTKEGEAKRRNEIGDREDPDRPRPRV